MKLKRIPNINVLCLWIVGVVVSLTFSFPLIVNAKPAAAPNPNLVRGRSNPLSSATFYVETTVDTTASTSMMLPSVNSLTGQLNFSRR